MDQNYRDQDEGLSRCLSFYAVKEFEFIVWKSYNGLDLKNFEVFGLKIFGNLKKNKVQMFKRPKNLRKKYKVGLLNWRLNLKKIQKNLKSPKSEKQLKKNQINR